MTPARPPYRRLRGAGPLPKGLTLIEVMVVMLIIAGMLVGGVLLFNDLTRANLKQSSLRVAGVVKYAYGQAAIRQQYHRMVIDLDSEEFWVEVSDQDKVGGPPKIPDPTLIGAPEGSEGWDDLGGGGYDEDDPEGSVFGLSRPPGYTKAEGFVLKEARLMDGIEFHSVFTSQSEQPVTTGRVSVTFFPNGFVERSQIVLTDGDDGYMTLELEPLTGKAHVLSGKHDAPRDFLEVEEDD